MEENIGKRFNAGKPQWSQLDMKSFEGACQVMMFGEAKYGRDNWRKGHPVRDLCDSLMRHLVAFMDGEDIDSESGLHHMDHAISNAMFIKYNLRENPQLDDRYKNVESKEDPSHDA